MDIHKIVVGVDGSAPSRAAVTWACGEAAALDVALTVAHVVDDDWSTIGSWMLEELRADAARLVERESESARKLAPELTVDALVLHGRPIAELARLSHANTLLVVGTHKSGFHYGRASGAKSLQLANLAAGPIAVVPESTVRFRNGIVVGVDLSPTGLEAIDLAAAEAARRGAELTLVRASTGATPSELLDDERQDWRARIDQTARRVLASGLERARKTCPDATIRSRVVRRPAGAALNEAARTAELLVIGASRRHERPGSLGSVAYDVLLNLTSPVVVVIEPSASATDRALSGPRSEEEDPAVQ